MMYCFKYYRTLGWYLLPINIGLAIGTVWGRFHYLSDVVVGGVIGAVATVIIFRYYEAWAHRSAGSVSEKQAEAVRVS